MGMLLSQHWMTISEVAEVLDIRPRDISDGIYQRRICTDGFQRFANRWLIPRTMLPKLAKILCPDEETANV